MARGQRRTIDEKIKAKLETVSALECRLEAEKKELNALYQEKKNKELETVNEMLIDAGLSTDQLSEILKKYVDHKEREAS